MRWVLLLVAGVTGCSANAESAASSESAATATEVSSPAALDCSQSGDFTEAAMKGVGDGTCVRAVAPVRLSFSSGATRVPRVVPVASRIAMRAGSVEARLR